MVKRVKFPVPEPEETLTEAEERMRALDEAEQAIDAAFKSGKAERAAITKAARDDALEAVRKVESAMEADAVADEAGRLAVIAQNMGDRERIANARKKAKGARRDAKQAHREATRAAKEAYDVIKFSQPGKLGFMRFVQVMYAMHIATTLFALILTSRDVITYNSVTIVDWITIILEGVSFWFFVNYYKAAKPTVIFTAAFDLVAYVIISITGGAFSFMGTLTNTVWSIFLILYFLLSKRVDDVLVNDFSTHRPSAQPKAQIQRSGWPFVRNLIIYFIIFSVLGHWMEAGMCQFIRLGWVKGEYDPSNTMLWRDWLYPYPMEGAAVVVIALVLYPLWQHLLKHFAQKPIIACVISFCANALTCSIIEFSMGLIVNSNHQLWNYSDMFGNIMGQVCLQNTLAFGVAASIIAWFVYPMLERWLARIPNDTMNIAFVVIAIIGGILWSLYIIDPPENHQAEQQVQTQEEKRLAEGELAGFGSPVSTLQTDLDSAQELLDSSQHLSKEQRQKIQDAIDELQGDVNDLQGAAKAV